MSYISDFDLKLSDSLTKVLSENIEKHLSKYSIKELSYLLISVMTQSNLKLDTELIEKIKMQIKGHSIPENDLPTQERLALCGLHKLDE